MPAGQDVGAPPGGLGLGPRHLGLAQRRLDAQLGGLGHRTRGERLAQEGVALLLGTPATGDLADDAADADGLTGRAEAAKACSTWRSSGVDGDRAAQRHVEHRPARREDFGSPATCRPCSPSTSCTVRPTCSVAGRPFMVASASLTRS